MIGILVATHGKLAEGLVSASELIAGTSEKLGHIGLFHGDSVETFEANMLKQIGELDDGDGVLMLVDFNGGSPANCALKCMRSKHDIRIIVGTNITMLIESLYARDDSTLDELCDLCIESGQEAMQMLHKEFATMMQAAENGDDDNDDF